MSGKHCWALYILPGKVSACHSTASDAMSARMAMLMVIALVGGYGCFLTVAMPLEQSAVPLGSGPSEPTAALSVATQNIAAMFGIYGGGSTNDDQHQASRKLVSTESTAAVCTCGGRTYRGSANCWCNCGRRKLAGTEYAESTNTVEAASSTTADQSTNIANVYQATTAAQYCNCDGRAQYGGRGCTCWVTCRG